MPAAELAHAPRRLARQARDTSAKKKKTSKGNVFNLRVDDETQSLIDRAAQALGQNRTDFVLTSARDRATEVLLNQTFFVLPAADWDAFVSAMDNPPPPNAKLKALLARKMPWED